MGRGGTAQDASQMARQQASGTLFGVGFRQFAARRPSDMQQHPAAEARMRHAADPKQKQQQQQHSLGSNQAIGQKVPVSGPCQQRQAGVARVLLAEHPACCGRLSDADNHVCADVELENGPVALPACVQEAVELHCRNAGEVAQQRRGKRACAEDVVGAGVERLRW